MNQLEALREISPKLPEKVVLVDREKLDQLVLERKRYRQTLLDLKALIPYDSYFLHKRINDALEPGKEKP